MQHIYITGCPRSGTTMLASIIGNGGSCLATPESHFFIDFIYKYLPNKLSEAKKMDLVAYFNSHYRFKQWRINANKIKNLPEKIKYDNYRTIVENTVRLYAENQSNKLYNEIIRVDHTPSNIRDFDIINELFPNSKFVFIIRDPRAIYASIKELDWGANSSLRLSQIWIEYATAYFAIQKMNPNRIYLTKYEDILDNPRLEISKICEFMGIDYSDANLEGEGFKIPEYTSAQHALVGKSLDKNRIEKWKEKITKEDILIIESKCKTIMSAFGYQATQNTKYKISKRDKLKMIFSEMFCYIPNKVRKRKREKNA